MKVQIWSDVMCPFCYIGKKNFEAAVAKLPFKEAIEVEWRSYQLDPTLDKEAQGITINEYLVQRKGLPMSNIEQMQQQVKEMGKNVGIDFQQEKAIVVNTLTAHRLIHFAQEHGKGNEMEEALFKAHFTEAKNVADVQELVQIAASLGLDAQKASEVLASDAYEYEVNQDILEARNIGVSGVPFFILNDKYAVSGAQPANLFEEALLQTYEETVVQVKSTDSANSCTIDGCE